MKSLGLVQRVDVRFGKRAHIALYRCAGLWGVVMMAPRLGEQEETT